jgi:phosphatidate cytidylyltransferase
MNKSHGGHRGRAPSLTRSFPLEDDVQDGKDSDQAAATPAEGVRIIGAEEAQNALAQDRPAARSEHADDELDLSDAERGDHRDVGYPDEGPSWSASETGDIPPRSGGEAPSGEVPPLQHWTEPPTGAVPAIFSDDPTGEQNSVDEDLDAWATISGSQPRFRAEDSDWAEADFHEELSVSGEHEKLGALSEAGPVDEDAEFEQALEERRRPVRRRRTTVGAAATTATVERPARPRPPEPDRTPPGAPSGRDLPTALITAGIVVGVAILCFELGRTATTLLAALIIAIATVEFCVTLQQRGFRPATLLALVGAATLPLAAKHYGVGAFAVYFAVIVVFALLWFLWQVTPGRPALSVAMTVAAFAYVGGLGGFAGLLLAAKDGIGLILGVVLCTVAYDVVGYFVGSQFGKSRIAPSISPNKTVAGTVGGMAASAAVGLIIVGAIHPWDPGSGLVLGLFVAVGAFLGDLCESMIKRDLDVKDFGTLLPGHGGILDRFDGLLFCLPIAYYLALQLGYIKF